MDGRRSGWPASAGGPLEERADRHRVQEHRRLQPDNEQPHDRRAGQQQHELEDDQVHLLNATGKLKE